MSALGGVDTGACFGVPHSQSAVILPASRHNQAAIGGELAACHCSAVPSKDLLIAKIRLDKILSGLSISSLSAVSYEVSQLYKSHRAISMPAIVSIQV